MAAQCVYIQQYNNVITLTKKVQNNTALKEFTDLKILVNGGRAGQGKQHGEFNTTTYKNV